MAERYSNPVVDDSLIDWVIREEGFLSKPTDIGDGKVTIGSGLTDPKWIEKYKKKGYWSKEDNRKAVAEELQKRSNWAEDTLPNWSTLPINAKRAMLSYKYNYDFTRENSPKLFGAMENGNFVEAIRQMDATSKNPKFKKGLQARREREQQWGLEGLFDRPSLDSRYEYPDATTIVNPYTAKVQNITFTDQAVPTNPLDNLIEAEKVSAEINEYDKVKRAIDTQASFRRLMQGNAWENQSEPERFVPQGVNYVIGYSDGGKLDKKKKWDDLSITEKSEMIDVAIRNGIVDLPTIKQKYNEFAEGGGYTVSEMVDAVYKNNPIEEYLGEPEHHYDFTQSEEWANAHGYFPDSRGHRDDRVKKPAHPSHPSRGTWINNNIFDLTDKGVEDSNYTMFGLTDGGQDPQAVLTYKGGIVLPEITVTPNGNYIENPYDNIRLHYKALGGHIYDGLMKDS